MATNEQTNGGNDLSAFSEQLARAVERAASSIVAIDARRRVRTSGVVWRTGGVIVSTNHTVERDEEITVRLPDGREAEATLLGRDAGTDLAVLKIADEEIANSLKAADIAETTDVKVGNIVLAIGKTRAEAGAVTASFGIVNQTGGAWRTWRSDEIERFISLDSSIFLGFSGGASVNAGGRVLGVNTSAFGRGLALTIPSETVNRVVEQILTKGKVSKPYLGIGAQTVPVQENLREKLNLEQTAGLMMLNVEAGGAAEKSGIFIGDILLALDEHQTLEPADVQDALSGKEAGQTARARILRGGEIHEIEIELGERPARKNAGNQKGRGGWRGRRGC